VRKNKLSIKTIIAIIVALLVPIVLLATPDAGTSGGKIWDSDDDGYIDPAYTCYNAHFGKYLNTTDTDDSCLATFGNSGFTYACITLNAWAIGHVFKTSALVDYCYVHIGGTETPTNAVWASGDSYEIEFREIDISDNSVNADAKMTGSNAFFIKDATECGTDANCIDTPLEIIKWDVSGTSTLTHGAVAIALKTKTDPGADIDNFRLGFDCRICTSD
jgi:hypothetical protein